MEFKDTHPIDSIPDEALEHIFCFLDDPRDRNSLSLVCKRWYHLDNQTRKDVTVAFCYSTTPSSLTKRFKSLRGLKLKGKPRAAAFNLIPEDWGGYAEPWVREIVVNCPCLRSVHFRRMVVSDEDLLNLAKERGHMLQELRLDRCSGFSTIGLEAVTRSCRSLRVLFLDESTIEDHSGTWLHELALHNSSLEVLSFTASNLSNLNVDDLDAVAANCRSLSSLRVNDVDLSKLTGLLNRAANLKELGGVVMSGNANGIIGQQDDLISLPQGLTSLVGLIYMGEDDGDDCVNSLVQPLASSLRKLDLQLAFLSVEGHCRLLQHCCNLVDLAVLNGIGDEGLEVVAKSCKNLRRLRVEYGDEEFQQGYVTRRGLIFVAQGCQNLEYLALYISNINDDALAAIGKGCPKLKDFRVVLLMDNKFIPVSPLDYGVRALLCGCVDLTRFALYLRRGYLTDLGMQYIGRFGSNLRWVLLGLLGETDEGFRWLADGCPKLERLEMLNAVFTEAGISASVMKMKSLKYIWVQNYKATMQGQDLLAMRKPFWNIEFTPGRRRYGNQRSEEVENDGEMQPVQFLAYHSLAGQRTDHPESVVCLC